MHDVVQKSLERLEEEGWLEYRNDLRRRSSPLPEPPRTEFEVDHPGHPLGHGMPTGHTLRDDGQSHRDAWAAITRKDPCAYCGNPAGTMDHIEPQARKATGIGGIYSWLNFTGACASCNSGKSDLPMLEYLYRRRWGMSIKPVTHKDFRRDRHLKRAA